MEDGRLYGGFGTFLKYSECLLLSLIFINFIKFDFHPVNKQRDSKYSLYSIASLLFVLDRRVGCLNARECSEIWKRKEVGS